MLVWFALRERHGKVICDCGTVEKWCTDRAWHEVRIVRVISKPDVMAPPRGSSAPPRWGTNSFPVTWDNLFLKTQASPNTRKYEPAHLLGLYGHPGGRGGGGDTIPCPVRPLGTECAGIGAPLRIRISFFFPEWIGIMDG